MMLDRSKFRFLATMTLSLLCVPQLQAQAKKRVAVLDFDDREVKSRDAKVGRRLSDALVAKLSETNSLDLVDRQYVDSLIKEISAKFDPHFDAAGAAKLGKLANVGAVIVGQVSAFNASVSSETSGNRFQKKTKQVGHVELSATARLLDVETGRVLAAIAKAIPTRNETLSESKETILIGGKASSAGDTEALLGKLIDRSVDDLAGLLAEELLRRAGDIAAPPVATMTIKVMGIENGLVFINRGAKDGVKAGMKYSIARSVVSSLVDPDTGKPVSRMSKVCTLSIAEVEDSIASGSCVGRAPKAGDVATVAEN